MSMCFTWQLAWITENPNRTEPRADSADSTDRTQQTNRPPAFPSDPFCPARAGIRTQQSGVSISCHITIDELYTFDLCLVCTVHTSCTSNAYLGINSIHR